MRQRSNPSHWIWQQPLAHRFDPDEGPYLALRSLMSREQLNQMEDLIAEGMSAEQIAALCHFDVTLPSDVVAVVGNALAFWVQRADEQR